MKQLVIPILFILAATAFVGCATAAPPAATPLPTEPLSTTEPTRAVAVPSPTRPALPDLTPQVPTPMDNAPTPQPGGASVITDPALLKLVNEAKNDLAARANVLLDEIKIVSTDKVEWRDSSLGCPIPGQMYSQVITPGYLILLQAAGKEWNYHAGRDRVVWCGK